MTQGLSTTRPALAWSRGAQGAWEARKLTATEMGSIKGGFLEEAASELGL